MIRRDLFDEDFGDECFRLRSNCSSIATGSMFVGNFQDGTFRTWNLTSLSQLKSAWPLRSRFARGLRRGQKAGNHQLPHPEAGTDGLFCERIFGPTKDWECHCGKYKSIRYKERSVRPLRRRGYAPRFAASAWATSNWLRRFRISGILRASPPVWV